MTILGVVVTVIDWVLEALMLVILVNALLSWLPSARSNALAQVLERVSDTVCNPIRRVVPTVVSGLDLSPMIAMVLLILLRNVLHWVLLG